MMTYASSLACPRGLACNVPRQVGSIYQALWTKARKNSEARHLTLYQTARKAGWTRRQTHVSPTLTYNLGRNYSLRAGQQVSILTLQGRYELMASQKGVRGND